MKRKNNAIRLIRKRASSFNVGEWLYLFGCNTGEDLYGVVRGCYEIRETKNHTDTGVTFYLRALFTPDVSTYVIEFGRQQDLHRIAGEPLSYVIQELTEPT